MEKRKIDCEMNLIAESSIDGLKIWLYEVNSQIGEIFIIDYQKKDETIATEFKTDRAEAEKLYKKQIKKMLAEN
jgi:hypothetical protein